MEPTRQFDRVVYKVEVMGGPLGLPIATYTDVGTVKLVPSTPAVLALYDTKGNHMVMLTVGPDWKINFTPIEVPRLDLTIPDSVRHYDFTKSH